MPADASINLMGRIATASGFGRTTVGILSNTLQAVNLTIVEITQCNAIFPNYVTVNHICTGNPGAQAVCAGDHGMFWKILKISCEILVKLTYF